ncbi:MAG: NuoI/complex I 23 kDa subunit family protein, partial [Sphingobacteriia bacterium]
MHIFDPVFGLRIAKTEGTGGQTKTRSMGYWKDIAHAMVALRQGFRLSWQHLRASGQRRMPTGAEDDRYFRQSTGLVTIQYPREQIPVPDVGRYRLHMETEDCIVCDQCARICPVDCITIEKVKAVEDLGTTSDGSKKRFYLPTFDIDMAKCCYCGLCTIVCPTECLLMTKVYDYAEYDRENFLYHFGNLSPEQTQEKEAALAAHEAAIKQAKAAAATPPAPQAEPGTTPPARPPVGPPPGTK